MPYYKWSGIDLQGQSQYGTLFAGTIPEAANLLLKLDVGLMKAKIIKNPSWWYPISTSLKIKNISYLSLLLKAEIRLYQALTVIIATTTHTYFKKVLEDIARAIEQGISLSNALARHENIFNRLIITAVSVGQETGNLAHVLRLLAVHFETVETFKQKIRSSLLIPGLTFCFFLLLLVVIFVFIIPRFAFFFESFKEPLPHATRFILSLSSWLQSGYALLLAVSSSFIALACYIYIRTENGKKRFDAFILTLPFFSSFLKSIYNAHFFQMLGILLQSGIHITQAISVARTCVNNTKINEAIGSINREVIAGKSLSAALREQAFFVSLELEALITVGESSGELAYMIKQTGELCQTRVYEQLQWLVLVVQPALLIFLGMVIAGLIFALYMPIFTLSTLIS